MQSFVEVGWRSQAPDVHLREPGVTGFTTPELTGQLMGKYKLAEVSRFRDQ
jgi:hypothetical protein